MTLRDTLFSFDGRLRRRDWWLWGVATSALVLAAYVVLTRVTIRTGPAIDDSAVERLSGAVLVAAVMVAFVWMQTAVTAKRVQDAGLPAWPFVAFQIAAISAQHGLFVLNPQGAAGERAWAVLHGLDLIGWGVSIIVLGFIAGTPGDNRFGPSPKAPAEVPHRTATNGAH
jgi:uncharacterized membrane protein YhaH (DUF805 family)